MSNDLCLLCDICSLAWQYIQRLFNSGVCRRTTPNNSKSSNSLTIEKCDSNVTQDEMHIKDSEHLSDICKTHSLGRFKKVGNGTSAGFSDEYNLCTGPDSILGTGLHGAVRKARHLKTGIYVAVKKFSTKRMSQQFKCDVLKEIEIHLLMDHPNICRLLEVIEDVNEGEVYLVMEMCTGRELFDRLTTITTFSERDAADVVRQILNAVNYCHSRDICHMDLKLENFLYMDESENRRLKLIDFGLSRFETADKPMGSIAGTVYYIAPEVLNGNYSQKSDLWSLGVITYMLISGRPPFDGPNHQIILECISSGNYDMNSDKWQTVSSIVKDFISKLLVFDPRKRMSVRQALSHAWIRKSYRNRLHTLAHDCSERSKSSLFRRSTTRFLSHKCVSSTETSNISSHRYSKHRRRDIVHKTTHRLNRKSGIRRHNKDKELFSDLAPKIIDPDVIKAINDFARSNAFRRASYGLLATYIIDESSLEILNRQFETFDESQTGVISIDDLYTVLSLNSPGIHKDEIEFMFKRLDSNWNGMVQYSEFIAAGLSSRVTLDENRVQELFNRMDVDNSGYITTSNLKEIFGSHFNGARIEEIFSEIQITDNKEDSSTPYKIDLDEFKKVLSLRN